MLPQAIDRVLKSFGLLRSRIDEALVRDQLRRIRWLWLVSQPRVKSSRVAGVDSGFNYIEYRGYALYVADVVGVVVDSVEGGEELSGDADADVVSTTFIESELSAYSIAMEIDEVRKLVQRADLVLVDGSLVAKFASISRAAESGFEIEKLKGISFRRYLEELIYLVGLHAPRIAFVAKNTNAKDVLGLVKGDVYYFERYTTETGFSKPLPLENSASLGVRGIASRIRGEIRRLVGIGASVYASYARFAEGGRVYRIEVVVEDGEDPRERMRRVFDLAASVSVSGYPYPLLRADQLARVSEKDVERVAMILGIAADPQGREVLWAGSL